MSSRDSVSNSVDSLADVHGETARLRDLAKRILELEEETPLPIELIQEGLTSLSKLYAVNYEKGDRCSPFSPNDAMPATVAMILVTSTLKAVNVEPFELGMWQSWSGS